MNIYNILHVVLVYTTTIYSNISLYCNIKYFSYDLCRYKCHEYNDLVFQTCGRHEDTCDPPPINV